jgi:lambda family phage tail tape measure protein
VLEQLPIVAELIAKKLGVTTGALRKLGSEGKLSTDVVFSAIIEATADIDERFAKMKPTMESVIQVIKDKFMVAIGQSSGAIDLATRALQLLSDNFDMAFRAATALAGVMAAMATGKFAMWAAAGLANPWVALAVAVAALTVAYTAFSDKIEISKDGTLKLNDVTNAWVSTFTKGIQEMLEGVGKLSTTLLAFIAGPFAVLTKPFKFSWDIDTLVDRLAIATDVMRVLADPGRMALAAVRDNPEDREWSQRTQNALKRERALAKGAEKDAFWVKQNETEAKWNAMMRDANKVGAASAVTPVKKGGGKEHGKTFEELIKEALFDEQNSKWSETEEKIRDRLHNMMEKLKPSIKAALEGVEGKVAAARRDFESEYAKNDGWGFNPAAEARARKTMESRIAGINSAHEAALKERDVLEDIVRQEATREFYAKQKLEDEKEMEAFLDERLKQMKEMEELEKRNRDKRSDKAVALSGSMTGIASSLSPNVAIAQRIAELQKFQDFARQNNLAEWASRANDEIQSLQRTMLFGMDPLKEYGDQMKSIFGPGGTLVKGFADAAANAIVMSQSLGDLRKALVDVLNSVQKQAISSLIQLPLNIAMGALTNSLTGGAGGSSLGGGARSLSAAEASNIQFSSGGYTGNMGTNEPAGIVHGQEFVLNADATRRMGKQNLDMINKGGTPTSASAVPANITINNNAGVIVETRQLSPGDVEVIVSKAIRDQTGRVVAGQINDPNSMVSRSMQKNIGNGERRRV